MELQQDTDIVKPQSVGPLIVYVPGTAPDLDPLKELLSVAGASTETRLDGIADRLRDQPDTRVLLFYPNPAISVAARLDDGAELQEAVAAWADDAKQLLDLFRADRRRITLVDGHAALGRWNDARRQLERRLSLHIPAGDSGAAADGLTATVAHLLSEEILRHHAVAGPLATELDASSVPLSPALRFDIVRVAAEWHAKPVTPEDEAAPGDLEQEYELLQLQLRQVYSELDDRAADIQRLQQQLKETRSAADKAVLVRRSLEEQVSIERAAWNQERTEMSERLKWVTDDLVAIRRSLSWRLTGPIRRFIGLFTGGTKL